MQKGQDRMLNEMVRVQHTHTGEWVDVPAYRMLTTEKMAEVSGLSERWFQDRRRDGDGPKYYQTGRRVIRYLWPDFIAWLAAQERSPYEKVFDNVEA